MMDIQEAIKHARKVAKGQKMRTGICTQNDAECDKFSTCLKCAEEHEQLAEWLEELVALREKQEKYRWHDLRKNPDDLPELRVECEVALKRTYSDYRMNGHARRLELSDGIYWYEEHYGFVQHPKCNNGCGGDNTIEVIAWREIEPFESEVKE